MQLLSREEPVNTNCVFTLPGLVCPAEEINDQGSSGVEGAEPAVGSPAFPP